MKNKTINLQLALKGEYFTQIKEFEKIEEFRLYNEYWCKRLQMKQFTKLILTLGYPSKEDQSKRIEMFYMGYTVKTITHPHFGKDPVKVFAIKANYLEQALS